MDTISTPLDKDDLLVGIDEAGRGPLAGPVVAAAVALPKDWILGGVPKAFSQLNDSKKLTPNTREKLYKLLMQESAIRKSVVFVANTTIDEINILKATHLAMCKACEDLERQGYKIAHVFIDGLDVPTIKQPHTAIVKGDAKCVSIAAASILAKVARDHIMLDYDAEYPGYGFAEHKGYGTAKHRQAILRLGTCPIHRRTFLKNLLPSTIQLTLPMGD